MVNTLDPPADDFAHWLRQRREQALVTQEELAAAAGVSARTVRDLERGRISRPRPATVRLIMGALAHGEQAGRVSTSPGYGIDDTGIVPRELPRDVYGFTGRDSQLAGLDKLIGPTAPSANSPVITTLTGTAGVGKTALAVHWAHQRCEWFPDGHLFLNLRGYEHGCPVQPHEALGHLLRGLGVSNSSLPVEQAERAARFRTLTASRRMLIVLDNASSVAQIRDLLPGTASCPVLVTSRDRLPGLVVHYGAIRMDLQALAESEAVDLLRRLAGTCVDAEPAATRRLVRSCGCLPLLLRVAAEQATARPGTTIGELAAELADDRRRLDLPSADGSVQVRTVVSWSLRHATPEMAATFGLLGLHPGSEFDSGAVAALVGVEAAEGRHFADQLVGAGLLECVAVDRYRFHDLMRAYAGERAPVHDNPDTRERLTRLHDYYLSQVKTAMDTAFPDETHLRPHLDSAVNLVARVACSADAVTWLDLERDNLISCALNAHLIDDFRFITNLSALCWRYFTTGSHHYAARTLHGLAVRAARTLGDAEFEAWALNNLASVCWQRDEFADAVKHLEHAVDVAMRSGDVYGECRARHNLAGVYWYVGRFADGVESYRQSVVLKGEAGSRPHEHFSYPNLAGAFERFGNVDTPIAYVNQALTLARRYGDRAAECFGLIVRGVLHRMLDQAEESAGTLQSALATSREIAYDPAGHSALVEIGGTCLAQANYADATSVLEEAVSVSRAIGHRANEGYALNYLGLANVLAGRYELATSQLARSLVLGEDIRDRDLQARTLISFGRCCMAEGASNRAAEFYKRAIVITNHTGNLYVRAQAYAGMAQVFDQSHIVDLAEESRMRAIELLGTLRFPVRPVLDWPGNVP